MALLLVLFLACGVPGGTVRAQSAPTIPEYVVILTQAWPGDIGRCTGVALDEAHVLTAFHCLDSAKRVIAQTGQAVEVVESYGWALFDVGVVEVAGPLQLAEYARFGLPRAGQESQIYGSCPHYFPHAPRHAHYQGWALEQTQDEQLHFYDEWLTDAAHGSENQVCGGDSGGVVVQDGQVVGLISAVEGLVPWLAIGSRFFAVPPTIVLVLAAGTLGEVPDRLAATPSIAADSEGGRNR